MIYTDSRYANGRLFKAYNLRKQDYDVTVFRNFPNQKASYFLYTWRESDRIDLVCKRFLGTAATWWKVMDYNPEILNPFDIPVGTVVRIPDVR